MEESIGKIWNTFLRKKINTEHEDARVYFTSRAKTLKLFHHLLGGEQAKDLHITDKRFIKTSRSFLNKISGTGKSFYLPWQDDKGVYLPESLALFPSIELNEMLYFWLIAMSTKLSSSRQHTAKENLKASLELRQKYEGFNIFYTQALSYIIKQRTQLSFKTQEEKDKEILFIKILKDEHLVKDIHCHIHDLYPFDLWMYPPAHRISRYGDFDDEQETEPLSRQEDRHDKTDTLEMKKQADKLNDKKETDGMLMFIPDSLMSIMEQVNVDRSEDDSFDEDALYNARDLDEITLGQKKANLSARLKMDLDLPGSQVEQYPLGKGHFIDEWDYRKEVFLKNYVCIKPIISLNTPAISLPKHLKPMVKKVQNELDLMEIERIKRDNLAYGDDINLDVWIDYKGMHNKSNHRQRFFESFEKKTRDISTLILADISLSTEAGITQNLRIIDVIKDSLMVFSEALERLQDRFGIYAFSSLKNTKVQFHIIKNIKEKYSDEIRGRIDAIKPGYYTRLGAAIRESSKILHKQKTSKKLLLIISDGKPNDVDRYDGRYGIEDTKKAISEAKNKGIIPFCVTVDIEAKDYLSYLFGKNGFVLIRDCRKLPKILPEIYMNLTK
ncbi:VWA domain-containing protein [Sulfurimonas sp. MAG313]|nr:VWA domain-containing protein [Sulfurimonas sp. MAG313]MDF1879730.1 VWA domain-containing protein [Sulfurimonas sp. MAG313]